MSVTTATNGHHDAKNITTAGPSRSANSIDQSLSNGSLNNVESSNNSINSNISLNHEKSLTETITNCDGEISNSSSTNSIENKPSGQNNSSPRNVIPNLATNMSSLTIAIETDSSNDHSTQIPAIAVGFNRAHSKKTTTNLSPTQQQQGRYKLFKIKLDSI